MTKRALLINPPVYDVQYWSEWSQPHGLLKAGAYLRTKGYETRLIDCLFPDARRLVPKKTKSVVEVCSAAPELPYQEFRKTQTRLAPNQRLKFVFGIDLDKLEHMLMQMAGACQPNLFVESSFNPDEIWITSIMTYWWESTVDVASLCRKMFPSARIRIGGIYPTLASSHLKDKLVERGLHFDVVFGYELDLSDQRDLVVVGEIPEASWLDLDFELYYQPDIPDSPYYHGPAPDDPRYETTIRDRRYYGPSYAILTTTRGCPFDCSYCAQHAYNLYDDEYVRQNLWQDGQGHHRPVRVRGTAPALEEIRDKYLRYGIRQFAFYEDNFLVSKDHFRSILQEIVDDRDLRGNIHLHAPEGVEVRLIDRDLADLMRRAGFERVYLPLENINTDVVKSWNRSHSNVQMFERAVQNCIEAGFVLRNMELNAFLLFGTPGEDIRNVVDSIIFASSRIGSVIPMLFTPVPGSRLYRDYLGYFQQMGLDLQHLNGKLFPFLRLNQETTPGVTLQDYLDLESLMFRVNAQAVRGTFNIGGESQVAVAFRKVLSSI